MLLNRVIPVLQIKDDVLVKTCCFKEPKYLGDPINAIKIFNEKEVDELLIVDISATQKGKINFDILSRMNKEAFMPLGYGGGVQDVNDLQKILALGYEKIVLDHIALTKPDFITMSAKVCGNQSVVVCIDVKKNFTGKYCVYDYIRKKNTSCSLIDWAKECEQRGAGEIIINDVEREGTFSGYNMKMMSSVISAVKIPVVILGGARDVNDLKMGIAIGASAVAAGSMFVFYGPYKAVLITYPNRKQIVEN
jgi:cyclase